MDYKEFDNPTPKKEDELSIKVFELLCIRPLTNNQIDSTLNGDTYHANQFTIILAKLRKDGKIISKRINGVMWWGALSIYRKSVKK